jgi:phage tail-like protein
MTFSGRGLMPDSIAPRTLGSLLPGVFLEPVYRRRDEDEDYQESRREVVEDDEDRGGPEFIQAFCAGLDVVLAPASVTLDCLDAYFDPRPTPSDFLDWLAGWVGLSLDQNWSEQQRRDLVMEAGELYRWQGTVRGIVEHIRLYTGVVPEVYDSGGVAWSTTPGAPLPGSAIPELRVEVTIGADEEMDVSRLDAIVAAVKPAHIPHTIKVVRRAPDPEPAPLPPIPPPQGTGGETPPPSPVPRAQGDGQDNPPPSPAPPLQTEGREAPGPPGPPAHPYGGEPPQPPTGPIDQGDS